MIRLLILTIIVMASALTSGCAAYAGARAHSSTPRGQHYAEKTWTSPVYVPTGILGVKEAPGAVPLWDISMTGGRTVFKAGGNATMNIKHGLYKANVYYYNRPARTAAYYVKYGNREQSILIR